MSREAMATEAIIGRVWRWAMWKDERSFWTGSCLLFCYVVALGLAACTQEGENPSPFDIQKGSVQEPFDIAVTYFTWDSRKITLTDDNSYAVEVVNAGTDTLNFYKIEIYFDDNLRNRYENRPELLHPGPLVPGDTECLIWASGSGSPPRPPKEPGRHSYRVVASLPSGYAEMNLSNNELVGFFEISASAKPTNLFSSKPLVGCRRY